MLLEYNEMAEFMNCNWDMGCVGCAVGCERILYEDRPVPELPVHTISVGKSSMLI